MERVPYISPVSLPLLVASSVVFLAELLRVGTSEDRPNMGPQGQGKYISEHIHVYFSRKCIAIKTNSIYTT